MDLKLPETISYIIMYHTSGKKGERGIVGEAVHRGYLDRHPYREYEQEDLQQAK